MKGKSGKFNQISYQNEYIKEKYDRINLTVPKGRKEEIKKKAASWSQIGRAVQQECRDRSRMPSSA